MTVLLEIFAVALLALFVARALRDPLKGRLLNILKFWVTIRAFWLLFSHPVKLEDGSTRVAGRLVLDTLANIDGTTFALFCALAAGIKFVGILSSMYRWQLLLRGQEIDLPFRHIFGSFLIGRFIGTFLPSTAGLDGYKLYDAARFSGRSVEVTATTVLEKVIGFSGIFLSFLVALPFGIKIFGENAALVAGIAVPFCLGLIGALLTVLWYPGLFQWLLESLPIPGKARLEGLVLRISQSAAAYRDKKTLVIQAFALSFVVHFTTAVMYYFTALAIGATKAEFWPVAFGSSIQILATVLSPFTIAGEGIREAAQYALLGNMIGPANAIVSAALGFWAAEALTLAGAYFWWFRPRDYAPEYCRVKGVQVDYAEAARSAADLLRDDRESRVVTADLPPLSARARLSTGVGLGAGVLGGVVIGIVESLVIAQSGFGGDAQALWYGPLGYAVVLGGLGALGGCFLALLPMDEEEIRGWTPSIVLIATGVPVALAIAVFRVRRDLYLEQMPPLPVLLGMLAAAAAIALALFLLGPRIFRGALGTFLRPSAALLGLLAVVGAGAIAANWVTGDDAGGQKPPPVPPALAERPNIVLVMVDTLRADHLSCYGSDVATPAMCSLAEGGGTRFEGFGHSSWTKPASATLLTSLLPTSHGAMSKPASLSEELTLVSEVFKERGYATGGVVSNINLAPSFGFDQGYDEYHYLAPDYLFGAAESSSKFILYQIARRVWFRIRPGLRVGDFYQDSETVNGVATDFLERHRDSRFFLFLHYMDPHDPFFEHPYDGTGVARAVNQHPDGERADEMRRLYVEEIEYLDANFAKLLAELKRLKVWEDTLIVLVADHGEEFHEHGGWWHGLTLYDEQIRVPFLVKWARQSQRPASGSDGAFVRMIDVAPTLVAQAGAAVPASMQGIDLVSGLATRSDNERMVFSEEDHEGNVLRALRTESWKLIEANPNNPRGLPERQLFHVAEDALERSDRHEVGAAKAAELSRHADAQENVARGLSVGGGGAAELSPEEEEALRQLGYID